MTGTELLMINRRVKGGYNRQDSETLLASLMREHSGLNLAYALSYNDFASDEQASKFVGAPA